jgi:hypothetical protein
LGEIRISQVAGAEIDVDEQGVPEIDSVVLPCGTGSESSPRQSALQDLLGDEAHLPLRAPVRFVLGGGLGRLARGRVGLGVWRGERQPEIGADLVQHDLSQLLVLLAQALKVVETADPHRGVLRPQLRYRLNPQFGDPLLRAVVLLVLLPSEAQHQGRRSAERGRHGERVADRVDPQLCDRDGGLRRSAAVDGIDQADLNEVVHRAARDDGDQCPEQHPVADRPGPPWRFGIASRALS